MAENELKVILKAKDLCEHTLRITSNCNRYPKKFRFSLVDKMQIKALEIYEYLYEANRTDLKNYARRKKIHVWSKLVKSEKMTEQKFYEKYNAWKNHALHGNCIKLCHSMDLYVKELLERK